MNGEVVAEYDAVFLGPFHKTVISLLTGSVIELNPGDEAHIVVNQYGNVYIDDEYVGQDRHWDRLEEAE